MKQLARTALVIGLSGLLGSPTWAEGAEGSTAAQLRQGRRLALQACAACHVVSSDQVGPPILDPPAPTFVTIAQSRDTTAKSIRHFLLTTHRTLKTSANMPSMLLSQEEAAASAAYILSLKPRS